MIVVPTCVNFKTYFSEFEGVPDARVEFAIEEAARNIDDSWVEKDAPYAILYLAAHYLMVSIMRAQSASGQPVAGERMGEMSINYGSAMGGATGSMTTDLNTTLYGVRFMELAHINFPAIAVI